MNPDIIETFMIRLRQSTNAKSKEVRLSLQEAQDFGLALSQLLVRHNQLLEKELSKKSIQEITEVRMDGGSF